MCLSPQEVIKPSRILKFSFKKYYIFQTNKNEDTINKLHQFALFFFQVIYCDILTCKMHLK